MRKCVSKAAPTQFCCVCCWSVWGDDRTAQQHEDLDCRRGNRSAAWLHRTQCLVQTKLEQNPLSGQVFIFRGRRGDLVKLIWFDGDGLCLLAKRLERGRFVWPQATEGSVSLTRAHLSMLLEGIDWRRMQMSPPPSPPGFAPTSHDLDGKLTRSRHVNVESPLT